MNPKSGEASAAEERAQSKSFNGLSSYRKKKGGVRGVRMGVCVVCVCCVAMCVLYTMHTT